MVNGLAFIVCFSAVYQLHKALHNPCYIHSFTHTYIHWCQRLHWKVLTCWSGATQRFLTKVPRSISVLRHSHPYIHWWNSHREQFGIQYLAKGLLDMQLDAWTTDLLISGRHSLPAEPQPTAVQLKLADLQIITCLLTLLNSGYLFSLLWSFC